MFVGLRKIHYNVMTRMMDMNEADILALVIAVGSVTVTTTYASIVGTFASGYDAGKQQAITDWNNGYRTANNSCPYDSLTYPTYCTGYVAGYAVGWQSEQNLQP